MVATGAGLRQRHLVLAAAARRGRRHAQPVGRRRQRVPPDRAGARRRPRRAPRTGPGCSRSTTCSRSSPARSARSCRSRPRRSRTGWTGTSPTPSACGVPALRRGRRVVIFFIYRRLHEDPRAASAASSRPRERRGVLRTSRRTVLELAGLFSLDSAGSGFVVTSLLVLWLHLRFDLSAGADRRGVLRRRAARRLLPAAGARGWPRASGSSARWCSPTSPRTCLLRLAAFAPTGGDRDRAPARPRAVRADGRPGPPGVRHGGGARRRAGRGVERHQRAPQPRVGRHPAARRRAARPTRRSAGRC